MTMDFSSKTMETRRKWHSIFQMLKENNFSPRIMNAVKITFRNEWKTLALSGERKLREFVASRPTLNNS